MNTTNTRLTPCPNNASIHCTMADYVIMAIGLIAILTNTTTTEATAVSQQRIDEIAAMLTERPVVAHPCSDRQTWNRLKKHPSFEKFVQSAEKLLSDPLPEQPADLFLDYSRTGERQPWEKVARIRRGRIKTLVLAECIENKGRFVPALEQLIVTVCDEPTWLLPAHDPTLRNFRGEQIDIDLVSSWMGSELSVTYALLHDKLSEETRQLIKAKVYERVLTPFRDMVTGKREQNWWMDFTNNWNSVCLAGITRAAVILVDDPKERALYIAAAEHYVQNFLSGFSPDGYCSEGLAYWNYGFSHYAMLATSIRQATDGQLDLLLHKNALQPAMFGSAVEMLNGTYPTFSDCPMATEVDAVLVEHINRRLGTHADSVSATYAPPTKGTLSYIMSFIDPPPPPTTESRVKTHVIPQRTWFDVAHVLICRPMNNSNDSTDHLAVAIKAGHNDEHHNHNDIGSFIVVANDKHLVTDPGAEVYTARTFNEHRYDSKLINSYGHSVPVVAGKLQRVGKQAQGIILRNDFTDAADTLMIDLKSAYDVPELTRLEREFRFERGRSEQLTVTDTVEYSEPESFETALITFGKWKQIEPNLLRIDDDGRTIGVRIDTSGCPFTVTSTLIDEDIRAPQKPTRLAVSLDQPVTSARICLRITPTNQQRETRQGPRMESMSLDDRSEDGDNHRNSRRIDQSKPLSKAKAMEPATIKQMMEHVGRWQLANPAAHDPRDWTYGAFYTGMMALVRVSDEPLFEQSMLTAGQANHWKPGTNPFFADDHCVGQMYIEMYLRHHDKAMLTPIQAAMDLVAKQPANESLLWRNNIHMREWAWCDSLFMAPPTLARLYEATGQTKYLDELDRRWWKTADYLYDKEEHLFYRDSRYFDAREANGRKVFWSRGNGWVLAGLARVLQKLPLDHPTRPRYEELFTEMSKKVATLQQSDGLWHASLLDPDSFPAPETSGSGFYCFALCWGINNGLLDGPTYKPVIKRAWTALMNSIDANGKLKWVQPVGADPRHVKATETDVYGVGAFLLAGEQMLLLTEQD